jgi:predicted nucleotidyltransferase
MLQNYNKYKIMQFFFDNPVPEEIGFHLREISRKIDIAPPSVKSYLNQLMQEKLIIAKKHRLYNYPLYYANRDSEQFKFFKRIDLLIRIKETGLVDYIYETLMPETIILFGSGVRGEDTEKSDIDIYVQTTKKKIQLSTYELKIKRRISLFFEKDFDSLSKELRMNIINGIILKGYLYPKLKDERDNQHNTRSKKISIDSKDG